MAFKRNNEQVQPLCCKRSKLLTSWLTNAQNMSDVDDTFIDVKDAVSKAYVEQPLSCESHAKQRAQIVGELKREARLMEVAANLLRSQTSEINWVLNLPNRLPIVVSASESDNPTNIAEIVVMENSFPRAFVEPIAKWFRDRVRVEKELSASIAPNVDFRQPLTQGSDCLTNLTHSDRFSSQRESWLKVFEFLDIRGRVRCGQTSRHMHDLFASVLWRSYRSFDVALVRPTGGRQIGVRQKNRPPDLKAIDAVHNAKWIAAIFDILKRTENSLRHLQLDDELPSTHLRAIFRLCGPSLESIVLQLPHSALPQSVRFYMFQKIRKIDFSTTSISLGTLASIPASVEVLLGLCPPPETDMVPFVRAHQNLTQLDIRKRVLLPLSAIADCCPRLEKLSLTGISFQPDFAMGFLRGLTELRLTANAQQQGAFVDANDVIDICANNSSLRVLSLRLSLDVSNQARRAFDAISSLRSLAEFEASYENTLCAIDDECIRRLVVGCGGSLRSLKLLDYLRGLTDQSIYRIGSQCRLLRWLEVRSRLAMSALAFRGLIDSIIAAPSWRTGVDTLVIDGRIDGVTAEEKATFWSLQDNPNLRELGVQFLCRV